jgi:hypothetical protein
LRAGRFLQTVDGADVRVVERGEQLRLALEARQPIGIAGSTLMATSRFSLGSEAR